METQHTNESYQQIHNLTLQEFVEAVRLWCDKLNDMPMEEVKYLLVSNRYDSPFTVAFNIKMSELTQALMEKNKSYHENKKTRK